MTTTITTKTGCQIDIKPDGLALGNDAVGCKVSTALTPDEARQIAATLTADQGGQWARDDLPSRSEVISLWLTEESRGESADAVLGAVVAHLNAHHPKPDADSLLYRAERAERERDAAVARAEQAEARIEGWREAHDALMENPCPVTLDEIATVLERTDSDTSHGDEVTYTDMADAVLALLSGSDPAVYVVRDSEVAAVPLKHDRNGWHVGQTWYQPLSRGEVKDLLAKEKRAMVRTLAIARAIGVEAEQAADPVEERVDALADAVYGDELVSEQMRGVLERLVRSGWILPEGVECK